MKIKKLKKIFSLEFYENIVIKTLRFFMHRNPLFFYFWVKYYLFDGAFRKDEENKKLFYGKYKTFNQQHPYISAGSSMILILLMLLSSFWFMLFRQAAPATAWWNDVWGYRKSIAVSNSSGSALTDFQVKILDNKDLSADITAGKIQSDLDDLRFTDLNGNLLPYWIEDATGSSVDVWIKMTSIPTSGATVYMYYGNPSASSTADGNKVFEFFDDFDSYSVGSLPANEKWTWEASKVSPSVVDDNGVKSLRLVPQSSGEGPIVLNEGTFSNGVIETRIKDANNQHFHVGRGNELVSPVGDTGVGFWIYPGYITLYRNNAGYSFWSSITNISRSVSLTSYHRYKVVINGSSWSLYEDGASSPNISGTEATYSSGYLEFMTYSGENMYVDFVAIRKYASIDPSAGTPSTEEKSKGPVAYWSFDEGTGTTANDSASSGVYATGGTVTHVNGYRIHTFTSSGTFTVVRGGNVEVLVVAGGGGGGSSVTRSGGGGGGGAGGLVHNSSYSVNQNDSIAVTVGAGGNPGATNAGQSGTSGENSVFSTITAIGGGGGGAHYVNGITGGSGGGAGYNGYSTVRYGGSATSGQGNAGGNTSLLSWAGGAGGGGAGGVGGDNKINHGGGDAGPGLSYDISGSSVTYATGGTGGSNSPAANSPNTGNGGDAAYAAGTAYAGASGIVIVRYPSPNVGTVSGATWKSESECVSGKCLYFSGTSQYVNINDGESLKINDGDDFSYSVWVKNFSSNLTGLISNLDSISGAYYGLSLSISNNTVRVYIGDGVGDYTLFTNTYPEDNKWHLINYVYDSGTSKVYIDTIQQSTTNSTTIDQGDTYFMIGKWANWYNDYYFKGFIDEPKVYNYARTEDEIRQDYNAGLAGMGTSQGVSSAVGSDSPSWMTDGLVGHWKMDEASWNGTSGEVIDASGNGNNGTSAGGATTGAGKFGNGGSFDGTDDYGYLNSAVNLGTTHTISVWAKKIGTAETIITGYDGSNYVMDFYNNNKIYYSAASATYWDQTWDTGWHHYVISRNGSNVTLYVDGVSKGVKTITNNSLSIDRIGDARGWKWNGGIDELRFYNRALSQQEVFDLYNYAPGPVGHWKMDDRVSGNSQTIVDSSGNGNNGTTYYGANATGMDCAVQGKYGTGCQFDGTDDYVNAGNVLNIDKNDFSFEAWIKIGASPGKTFIEKRESNSRIYQFGFQDGTTKLYFNYNHDGNYAYTIGNTSLQTNVWYHVSASVPRATGYPIIYINGIDDGYSAHSLVGSPSATSMNNTGNLLFGVSTYTGYTGNFNGLIDDVKFYNYVRTSKQIVEDMNAGHPAGGSPVGSQVSYWKFDEGYGTTAYDSITASGNDGTLTNGPTWTNEGKFGKALSFDGTDDYLNTVDVEHGSTFSLSAWIKATTISGDNRTIISKRTDNDNWPAISLHVTSGGALYGYYSTPVYGQDLEGIYTADGLITTNQWYHVMFTKSGDYTTMELYINGRKMSHSHYLYGSHVTSEVANSSKPLMIGRTLDGVTWVDPFVGLIDEVKIYNYALTEDEVKKDYNQGKSLVMGSKGTESDGSTPSFSASREYCIPGDTATCNPPIAEWKLDEKEGTTANDTSGNNRYLSFSNSPSWLATGKVGSALDFDPDDYASYDWADFSLGPQTIEFWMKADTVNSGWRDLVGTTLNSDVNRFHLYATNNYICWYNILGACGTIVSNVIPVSGQWYHVVGTTDGTTAKLYINGQLNNSGSCTTASYTSTGAWVGGTTEDFDGKIDDVKIYNYARTPAQIAWDYNRGKPVGWWRMDEGEGTTIYDHSGNGNNGTMTNMDAGTDWVDGKINKALDFDGSDDYVEINNAASELGLYGNSFTINAWYYADNSDGWDYAMYFRTSTSTSSGIFIDGGSASICFKGNGTSSCIDHPSAQTWHLLTFRYDGSTKKIFVDGIEKATVGHSSGFTNTGESLFMGDYSSYNAFNGQIDDVRIYNYALTAEQVKEVMNNGAVNYR